MPLWPFEHAGMCPTFFGMDIDIDNEAFVTIISLQEAVAVVAFMSAEVTARKIDYLPLTPKLQPQIPMEKLQ